MERIKKKWALKCISIVTAGLLIFSLLFVYLKKTGTNYIPQYIRDYNVVYIPEQTAIKFYHQLFSIDNFGYWVIKLSPGEIEKVENDIKENKNWYKYPYEESFQNFNFEEEIALKNFNKENSYICIFDERQEKIIPFDEVDNPAWWLFFIYDSDNHVFYCYYQTL